ncbi:MAG: prepilin peptidase [Candidatus Gastranaerophilales bacterium]|nr:prepilin peptidase [Candidatus Gastranaerophilales bacterium]
MTEVLFNYCGIFVFAIGLCIGSFLNVVALRAFTGESIVLPASKCPKCGAKIKPYDNIPVLSWIVLGGKCRNCKNPISIQYPIVEFFTALGFLGFYYHYKEFFVDTVIVPQKAILLPFFLVLFCLSVVIAITDIKEKVVFDVHTISLAVIIILFQFMAGHFLQAIIGLIVGALSMELLSGIGWVLVRKRAFGTGDSYIAASMGALLGWKMFFVALIVAVFLQILCIIPSFIKKLHQDKEYNLLITSAVFCIMLIFYKLPFFANLNEIVTYIFLLLLTLTGLYLCKSLLSLKTLKDNPTYWPFGPSLLMAMFLTAFYGGDIAHFLTTLF